MCVLGEESEWKGASWEGGSTKEDQQVNTESQNQEKMRCYLTEGEDS